MNIVEHLFVLLSEEAGEIVQAVGKIGRFGVGDIPPGKGLVNNEYLVREINDLLGVIELIQEQGIDLSGIGDRTMIDRKKYKVRQFMRYAYFRGTLETEDPPQKICGHCGHDFDDEKETVCKGCGTFNPFC